MDKLNFTEQMFDPATAPEFLREAIFLGRKGWDEVKFEHRFQPDLPNILVAWQGGSVTFFAGHDGSEVLRAVQMWHGATALFNPARIIAHLDGVFVEPEYRHQSNEFMRYGAAVMRARGTTSRRFEAPVGSEGAHAMMKTLNARPIATVYEL